MAPQRRFAATQHDVGNRGQTGLSANTARTDALDPEPTLATSNCCVANFAVAVGCLGQSGIRRSGFMECRDRNLLGLDAREFDHLAPFFCFVGDVFAKVGG
jgi:hypothetical protein